MPQKLGSNEGRRSRKARETRERIAQSAIRLFLAQGFDETTLDTITEAADISRRTFFHYFSSKEAILQTVEDGIEAAFRDGLAATPDDIPPLDAVRMALLQLIARYQSDEAIALDRLMRSTEALRVRKQANYEQQEKALFSALCEKWPDPRRRSNMQTTAMASIGAMRLATDRWREAPSRRPLAAHVTQAFSELTKLGA